VLQDTLDRSIRLASAMDSRGYGRRVEQRGAVRRLTGALTLLGLLGAAVGLYGLLDTTAPAAVGLPMLLAGLALCAVGIALGGRAVRRTVYRADRWGPSEWLVAASGAAAAAALLWQTARDPSTVLLPLAPLAPPVLPPLAVAGLLLAALPALVAPDPPRPRREGSR
jgi:energy-coupling factor transport system permease protein